MLFFGTGSMRSFSLVVITLALGILVVGAAGGCGSPAALRAPKTGSDAADKVTVFWRIRTPEGTTDGRDIDDADHRLSLVVRTDKERSFRLGTFLGGCQQIARRDAYTAIQCGPHPHWGRKVIAFVAKEKANKATVWREVYDVVIEDDLPQKEVLIEKEKVGNFGLPAGSRVWVDPVLQRQDILIHSQ